MNALLPLNTYGIWTLEYGSGIITDVTDPNTYVSNLSQGLNIFKWTLWNDNCTDYDVVNIIFDPLDIKDILPQLKIYPNPFNDFLILNNDYHLEFKYEIFDILGKSIRIDAIEPYSENKINLSELNEGMYFIRFSQNIDEYLIKIIKE